MLDSKVLSELSSLSKNAGISPLTVITSIKYDTFLIKAFNNVTFAYDPNWNYEQGNPTYPISFFYVKNMLEQMVSDVSQKPMLFYDTVADGNDATKGGLMNIVADNIINKPKEYKMDIIIPSNDSTFKNTSFSFDSIVDVHGFMFSNGEYKGTKAMSTATSIVDTCLSSLDILLKALYGTSIGASSILNALLQQQDYNKTSLEYMWSNRRIIKLKLWNGWKFKHLIIKNLEITKKGEDGDFYEGTLICQEVPILTFREQGEQIAVKNKLSVWTGNLIKSSVNIFVKAMTATLGEN